MHTIRLRGFWETISTGAHTIHSRQFGRPRTLDADERVWLVCTRVPAPAEVAVNGHPVATVEEAGPLAVDITEELVTRNRVEFKVESAELLDEVALEIRRQAK